MEHAGLQRLSNNRKAIAPFAGEHLIKQKLGSYWEASVIDRDAALNANLVLPRQVEELSQRLSQR